MMPSYDEIMAAQAQQTASPEPSPVGKSRRVSPLDVPEDQRGWAWKMGAGAYLPFEQAALGIKQMLGGLSDEDVARVKANRQALGDAGGWGIAGSVVGAAPAMVVGAGLPAYGAIPSIAGAAGYGAATGAVQPVLEGESRLSNMALGGALGGTGGALGYGIGAGITRALRPSRAARQVLEQGRRTGVDIPLTMGQRKPSLKGLEDAFQNVPFARTGPKQMEAVRAWNRAEVLDRMGLEPGAVSGKAWERVSPLLKALRRTDSDVADLTAKVQNELYDVALSGRPLKVSTKALREPLENARKLLGEGDDYARFSRQYERILSNFGDDGMLPDASRIKRLESQLRKYKDAAARSGNVDMADAYDEALVRMRALRNEALPADAAKDVQMADRLYASTIDPMKAMAYKGARAEQAFTPSQLESAIAQGKTVRQKARLQPQQAEAVFGNQLPKPGPGTAEKLMLGAGVLFPGIGAPLAVAMKSLSNPTVAKYLTEQLGPAATRSLYSAGAVALPEFLRGND